MALTEEEPQTKYYAECAASVRANVGKTEETWQKCDWNPPIFSSEKEANKALGRHLAQAHPTAGEAYGYVRPVS